MKIKTSDLKEAALDWAVECAVHGRFVPAYAWRYQNNERKDYSIDWAQGGLIIETNHIELQYLDYVWTALMFNDSDCECGLILETAPTPLIAAMRCYVASKLGDEVDVPKEQLQ